MTRKNMYLDPNQEVPPEIATLLREIAENSTNAGAVCPLEQLARENILEEGLPSDNVVIIEETYVIPLTLLPGFGLD